MARQLGRTDEDPDYVHVFLPGDQDSSALSGFLKKRPNILRQWRALPRLLRSVLSLLLAAFVCLIVYNLFPRERLVVTTSERYEPLSKQDNAQVFVHPIVGLTNDHKTLKGPHAVTNAFNLAFPGPQNERQRAVVKSFLHAWHGYREYAWGHDHLKSVSSSHHDWFGLGLTLVDSLDTMLIMGLKYEFEEAKQWVENELTFTSQRYVNLFEVSIRVLGGLLSAFHLSGENVFADKASDLVTRLMGAFGSDTPIPFSDVSLNLKKGKSPSWSSDSSLSEVTSIQLEFRDVSRVTGIKTYEDAAFRTSLAIHAQGCSKFDGLCPMFVNPKTGKFHESTITMGARADSYYEYLLKQWLQTGKSIDWLKDDYLLAMKGMRQHLWAYSEPNKLAFVGEVLNDKSFHPKMDHLVCFLSGTLALGAQNGLPKEHMDWAKELAHTCFQMYNSTATGLSPEIAYFNILPGDRSKSDIIIKPLDSHYLLRPEAVESFFYLYRFTGDKLYQDYGWAIFQAIEKYAKTSCGYASISNVKRIPAVRKDMMESFFLSETLKYLYLLFDDDMSLVPLDKFIFNTEGHPLPIL